MGVAKTKTSENENLRPKNEDARKIRGNVTQQHWPENEDPRKSRPKNKDRLIF